MSRITGKAVLNAAVADDVLIIMRPAPRGSGFFVGPLGIIGDHGLAAGSLGLADMGRAQTNSALAAAGNFLVGRGNKNTQRQDPDKKTER